MPERARLRVGVLASGRGSNFQAMVAAAAEGRIPGEIVLLLSDRGEPREHPGREAHDKVLIERLESRQVGLVCLAGYMRILGTAFVEHFRGRLLNIHPSLLPAFPGLHAQRQALEHGVTVAGATVHFVDEGTDTGPIVLQAAVPVLPDDTEATLSARILAEEHRIYPDAIRLFAEGRLHIEGRRVRILGEGRA